MISCGGTWPGLARLLVAASLAELRGDHAYHRLGSRHEERGRRPLVGHVGDDEAERPRVTPEEVVEVAADLTRRLQGAVDLHGMRRGRFRKHGRDHAELDLARRG